MRMRTNSFRLSVPRTLRARRAALVAASTLATLGCAGWVAGQVTTWTGPGTGSWGVAGNWNNGLPNNASFTALVDDGNAQNTNVTVNSAFTVGTLGISASDRVTIANSVSLAVTSRITNLGTITIAAGANNASLSTGGGSVLLTGGGNVVMGGANAILGNNGTLTNADNTIAGQGAIAGNGMFFINQGTVNADVNGGNIFIDPSSAGMTNSGVLTSSNGGTLRMNGAFGGGLTNTGTVSAQNGSVTQFENSFGVTGGTFATSGTGVVKTADGNTVNYASINNLGNWTLGNNSTSNYSGDLFNSGSINLTAAANDVTMNFNSGTTTLTGAGTINMGYTGAGEAVIGTGSGRLVNVNNLIRGSGRLGNNNQRITNDAAGIIQADVPGARLFVDPIAVADGFVNNGVMRATNGGQLQFTGAFGGGVTNTGTIQAQGGSTVILFNSIGISGGTLATVGSGSITVAAGNPAFIADNANVGSFVIQSNATLHSAGTLLNSGVFEIAAAANNALFRANAPLVLSGNGTFLLTDTGAAGRAIFGDTFNPITLGSGQTIRGVGNIASNNTTIVNNGVISADQSGKTIFVDPVAATDGFVNNNLMTATAGGILQLTGQFGGGVTNNGTISAQSGSLVQLINNIGVSGGTLLSSGGGAVEVAAFNQAFIANLTTSGVLNIQNNATLNGAGTLANHGVVNVNAAANNAVFQSNAPLTISGNGQFVLSTTGAGVAFFGNTAQAITIGSGQTVRGFGNVANNNTPMVNNGVINADVSGQVLFVDPRNEIDGFVNNNLMTATNGGLLRISGQFGGGVTNNGTILAQDTSRVQLVASIGITGGTFNSTGTGAVDVAQANAASVANVANVGVFNILSNSSLAASGTLLNNGTLNLSPGTGNAALSATGGTLLLTGSGVINMNAGSGGVAFLGLSGSAIDINHTVRGRGNIAGNNVVIVNRGLIEASGGGELFIDPINATDGFHNLGTMRATAGSQLHFNGQFGGGVNNSGGHIDVDAGGTLLTNSSHAMSGGTITVDGVWNATNSSNTSVIHFRGNGTLNISNSARVGLLTGGGTLGTSRVTALSITANGRLDLNDHDLAIDYTGPSVVASLRPLLQAGFGGATWNGNTTMITTSAGAAASATPDKTGIGYAEATDVLGPSPTSFRGVPVDATTAVLRYTLLGDANLDAMVNIADFSRLAASFNQASLWINGDFNYDGTTGIADFSLLAANFNKSLPPAALPRGAAVPEPATVTGLALAAAAMLLRRQRH